MKIVLLVASFYCIVVCGNGQELEIGEKNLIDLGKKHVQELQCIHRLDKIIASKWARDLQKIASTKDLGDRQAVMYPFLRGDNRIPIQEVWLREDDTTNKKIDSCFRSVVQEIVPFLQEDDINCINAVFGRHIREEINIENNKLQAVKKDLREDLIFRKYVTFPEIVEILFKNRNPDSLESDQRAVYENIASFIRTETDNLEYRFIIQSDCSFEKIRRLHRLADLNAKLAEFSRQVVDIVNQRVGSFIIEYWNPYKMLSQNKYTNWRKAYETMMSEIKKEVVRLRDQNKDAQSLCRRATELAYQFSIQQLNILNGGQARNYAVGYLTYDQLKNVRNPALSNNLNVINVLLRIKRAEENLSRLRDIRHPVLRTLLSESLNKTTCFSAFHNIVKNHHRFEIMSLFVSNRYTYFELYCRDQRTPWSGIAANYCKCVGSFCIRRFSPAVAAYGNATATGTISSYLKNDRYNLIQAPNGTYYLTYDDTDRRRSKDGDTPRTFPFLEKDEYYLLQTPDGAHHVARNCLEPSDLLPRFSTFQTSSFGMVTYRQTPSIRVILHCLDIPLPPPPCSYHHSQYPYCV